MGRPLTRTRLRDRGGSRLLGGQRKGGGRGPRVRLRGLYKKKSTIGLPRHQGWLRIVDKRGARSGGCLRMKGAPCGRGKDVDVTTKGEHWGGGGRDRVRRYKGVRYGGGARGSHVGCPSGWKNLKSFGERGDTPVRKNERHTIELKPDWNGPRLKGKRDAHYEKTGWCRKKRASQNSQRNYVNE